MRVLVLGGDGFCGWPTTLYLSDRGHDITIIDNLSRRKIDVELEVDSLTPIRPRWSMMTNTMPSETRACFGRIPYAPCVVIWPRVYR